MALLVSLAALAAVVAFWFRSERERRASRRGTPTPTISSPLAAGSQARPPVRRARATARCTD
jgi:hypothetical protein